MKTLIASLGVKGGPWLKMGAVPTLSSKTKTLLEEWKESTHVRRKIIGIHGRLFLRLGAPVTEAVAM